MGSGVALRVALKRGAMAGGSGTGYFWLRRLHTVAGLWLAFVYFAFFLVPMSSAFGGAASFNETASYISRLPLAGLAFTLLVLAPLMFHAAMGVSLLYTSSFNVISYGFYRNWMYALQRVTGIVVVPFAAYHIAKTILPFAFTGRFADFAFMQALMGTAWVRALYSAGVLCAAFHIGNGVASALSSLGITGSKRSQDAFSMAMWIVTLVFAVWGLRIVFAF